MAETLKALRCDTDTHSDGVATARLPNANAVGRADGNVQGGQGTCIATGAAMGDMTTFDLKSRH